MKVKTITITKLRSSLRDVSDDVRLNKTTYIVKNNDKPVFEIKGLENEQGDYGVLKDQARKLVANPGKYPTPRKGESLVNFLVRNPGIFGKSKSKISVTSKVIDDAVYSL